MALTVSVPSGTTTVSVSLMDLGFMTHGVHSTFLSGFSNHRLTPVVGQWICVWSSWSRVFQAKP